MFNFIPAKILSYDARQRTAQVQIDGLTDVAEDGLTATFAYPVGHDDRDTEIQVLATGSVFECASFDTASNVCSKSISRASV